jgi:putative two-component system response regulator
LYNERRNQADILEQKVEERTRQLSAIWDSTMVAVGSLAETRDNKTGNHIRRAQRYV